MTFTAQEITDYLAARGLTVERPSLVAPRIGRNYTAVVPVAELAREIFIKRGGSRGPTGDGVLLNEGLFHLWWHAARIKDAGAEAPDAEGVGDVVIPCLLHDRSTDTLILEAVPGSWTSAGEVPLEELEPAWAQAAASTLIALRKLDQRHPARATVPLGDAVAAERLDLTTVTTAALADLDVGTRQVACFVQRSRVLREFLAESSTAGARADDDGRPPSIAHRDFRLGNFLVHGPRLRVVDWELAGEGPALLDPGGLVADVITAATHRLRVEDGRLDTTGVSRELDAGLGWLRTFFEHLAGADECWDIGRDRQLRELSEFVVRALLVAATQRGRLQGRVAGNDLFLMRLAERIALDAPRFFRPLLTA